MSETTLTKIIARGSLWGAKLENNCTYGSGRNHSVDMTGLRMSVMTCNEYYEVEGGFKIYGFVDFPRVFLCNEV